MTDCSPAPRALPYRHVHLDFHTSGEIPDVGSRFDADAFARAYRDSRVGSVNLFAKCHHGYSYHPTEVGRMHPTLSFDLLGAQIDALQGTGIRTPIYVSALWDELMAHENPGWRAVDPDHSRFVQHGDADETGWKHLDLASPYRDYLLRQIEEVAGRFPRADGLWIDICFQRPSISTYARDGMAALDLDPFDPSDRDRYSEHVTLEFFAAVRRIADATELPVFFNLGHVRRGRAQVLRDYFSHVEIESLPTGGWGYEHFPVSARYVEGLGMPFLGMTGKFHHLWGEMGGYKPPKVLRYECAAMMAQGARVCVGDHLDPTGATNGSTHEALRVAFAHVEACEPYVEGTRNRAEIGVLSHEAMNATLFSGMPAQANAIDDGTVRALLETGFTFDVLDRDAAFDAYCLLILPDAIAIDAELEARIEAHLAAGGRLLVTGASGLHEDGTAFAAGTVHEGRAPFERGDYVLPVEALRAPFVDDPLFLYGPSERLRPTDGEGLGEIYDPYFDRGRGRFSGHLHTPPRPEPNGYVFGSEKDGVIRLAHPVFSLYGKAGSVALLRIIERVLERALGRRRMVETTLPTAGRATLRAREDGATFVHLLHANPVRRGMLRTDHVEPIQDFVTLRDVEVDVELDGLDPTTVRVVPDDTPVDFEIAEGRLRFTLPELRGHAIVAMEP